MEQKYYAHTSSTKQNEELIDHLNFVGDLAEQYAGVFNCGKIGKQLGLLHDVGKATKNFQLVLQHKLNKQDHAIVSAIYYLTHGNIDSKLMKKYMSVIMAGHHSYLYNEDKREINSLFNENQVEHSGFIKNTTRDKNKDVITENKEEYNRIIEYIDKNNLLVPIEKEDYLDIKTMSENEKMFFSRMLFSCLVDADYSATAMYCDNIQFNDKKIKNNFLTKLNKYHTNLVKSNPVKTPINTLRNKVYRACTSAGKQYNGFSTLTAPTGTGKTLALMKFALENAKKFRKDRVFVVLPFLSIIDQNADVYKEIFGDENVLIDNSQTEYTDEIRIYSERWNYPIIVTTSVKFFETLFSCEASNIRRLHNVSNSVIVFDECQTLPSELLCTTLEVLYSLTKYYNTSVLFSTATKPSYEYRNHNELFDNMKVASSMQYHADEVIKDVDKMFADYEKIKNTNVICDIENTNYTVHDLLDYFQDEKQVLCIFNTVKHANEMYESFIDAYGEENCYLITSRLCQYDRQKIIADINSRLKKGEQIYVSATACVEAGVDFDFKCGAREYAPLDSIIQAAGRVNRNGKYDGKFLIFMYVDHNRFDYPSAAYQWASKISFRLSEQNNGLNLYDQSLMDKYYKSLYQSSNYSSDKKELYNAMKLNCFSTLDDAYELIENMNQATIVVPPLGPNVDYYALEQEIISNNYIITKGLMKKLAKYTVQVYVSKNNNPSNVANQLSFEIKGERIPTNWFLLREKEAYTKLGINLGYSDILIF